MELAGDHNLRSLDSVERFSDPNKGQFENQILNQFAKIVHEFEPQKIESTTKTQLKQVSFEDAVRELLELSRKKQ